MKMADTVVSFFEDVSPLLTALRLDPFAARLSGYMIGGGKGRGCMVSQRYNVYIQTLKPDDIFQYDNLRKSVVVHDT